MKLPLVDRKGQLNARATQSYHTNFPWYETNELKNKRKKNNCWQRNMFCVYSLVSVGPQINCTSERRGAVVLSMWCWSWARWGYVLRGAGWQLNEKNSVFNGRAMVVGVCDFFSLWFVFCMRSKTTMGMAINSTSLTETNEKKYWSHSHTHTLDRRSREKKEDCCWIFSHNHYTHADTYNRNKKISGSMSIQ